MQPGGAAKGCAAKVRSQGAQRSKGRVARLVCAEEHELAPRRVLMLYRPATVAPPHLVRVKGSGSGCG